MKEPLIIHVNFQKFISEEKTNFYFGSIASLFDYFNPDEVGVSKATLYNHFKNDTEAVYITPNCIIRKSRLMRKKRVK